ncbi:MAG: hypothetical protein LBS64_05795 [Spirochaetaceae bacterium]|jgi:YbbR domain-containing protein|nr:hypothetical protein [Spirochaetaceae bacterium]
MNGIKNLLAGITRNWYIKVPCLVLALGLHYFYQISSLDQRSFSVPLTVKAGGLTLPAGPVPSSVRVTVRGNRNDVAGISENDLSAILDISYYSQGGAQNVPVLVSLSDAAAQLDPLEMRVTPDVIGLKVELRKVRAVPIKPMLEGLVSPGREVTGVTVMPSTVQVSGPESVVDRLAAVWTQTIDIDSRQVSFTGQVGLELPTPLVRFVEVSRDTKISVIVMIAEKIVTQRITLPVTPDNLAGDLRTVGELPTVEVEFSGSQNIAETISAANSLGTAAVVDCAGISETGIYELPVQVTLPAGLSVTAVNPPSIPVELAAGEEE